MTISLKALASRVFKPQRQNLGAARAALAGIENAQSGWNLLGESQVIPLALYQGPRTFAVTHDEAMATYTQEIINGQTFDYPPSMEALLTFASDPNGALSAERHLEHFFERLQPWNAEPLTHPRWLFAPVDHPHVFTFNGGYVTAIDSLEASLQEVGIKLNSLLPDEGKVLPSIVGKVVAADAGWRLASERGIVVSRACWPPQALADEPFSGIANPFEPLLDLWMTGYLLDVGEKQEDVWLVAPLVDAVA